MVNFSNNGSNISVLRNNTNLYFEMFRSSLRSCIKHRTTTQRFKSELLSSSGEMLEEESSVLLKRHVVVLSLYALTMGKVQIQISDVSLVTLSLENCVVHFSVLSKYTG